MHPPDRSPIYDTAALFCARPRTYFRVSPACLEYLARGADRNFYDRREEYAEPRGSGTGNDIDNEG